MPLIKSVLVDEIRKISDEKYSNFEGFPKSAIEVATRWSEAINKYGSLVLPKSTTSEIAKQALKEAFLGLSSNALIIFPSGLMTYSTQLALGMSPSFIGKPPVILIDLSLVYSLGFSGGSARDCANLMANLIDLWFKTGTATNPSSGATTNWN
jgi:hypothetical protein